MSKDNVHALQHLLDYIGNEDVRSYSGRGMYGSECLGVVVPRGELGDFIADLVEGLGEFCDGDEDSDINHRDVADGLRMMRTDDMGRDMIVYFPGVPYVGEQEEDNEQAEGQETGT